MTVGAPEARAPGLSFYHGPWFSLIPVSTMGLGVGRMHPILNFECDEGCLGVIPKASQTQGPSERSTHQCSKQWPLFGSPVEYQHQFRTPRAQRLEI